VQKTGTLSGSLTEAVPPLEGNKRESQDGTEKAQGEAQLRDSGTEQGLGSLRDWSPW